MKIGDRVKILKSNPDNDPDISPFPAGVIGIIIEDKSVDKFYDNPYCVSSGGSCWWYKAENLKLV